MTHPIPKTLLVTGARSGLGRALAQEALLDGALAERSAWDDTSRSTDHA